MKKYFKFLTVSLLILALTAGCQQKASTENKEASTQNKEVSIEKQKVTTKEEKVAIKQENESLLFPEYVLGEDESSITYLDPRGEKLTVAKKPKKVVVLLNSVLDVWYLAGGEAIGRCNGTTNVPAEAMNIEQLGKFSSVSLEKLLALEPDLVILTATSSHQRELMTTLEENGIGYMDVNMSLNPYESFEKNLYLFSKILGTEEDYQNKVDGIIKQVNTTVEKAVGLDKSPSGVILFSSTRSVKCELPISLSGEIFEMLGGKNIVADQAIEGATKVEFSMEKVLEADPEYIFITTMGDVEKCKARVEKDIVSNDAWGSLTAVKEGRVYYLPKDLFMYKPNARYPEAFDYMANLMYPGEFK